MRILMRAGMSWTACLTAVACAKDVPSVEAPPTDAEATTAAEALILTPGPSSEPVLTKADTRAGKSAAPQTRPAAHTPVPISADDRPGRARQARCQVGMGRNTNCTFTPLFGDGSFQLDAPDIALRMIISGDQGHLFAVFPDRCIPTVGTYRRDPRDRACWIANEKTAPTSKVCAR